MKSAKLYIFSVGMIVMSVFGIASSAQAATNKNHLKCDNIIISGLWQGINTAFGINLYCAQPASQVPIPTPTHEPVPPAPTTHVALGDSVAAGLGLPSSAGSDPACGVSDRAYGALIAEARNYEFLNLACSGATAGDLGSEQHLSGTDRDIEPQLDRAFASGTPSLITVTAGANDMYWQYFALKCYVANCGTSTDRAIARSLTTVLAAKMDYIMQSVQSRSNGQPPRVIFTGYYQPFSATCSQQIPAVRTSEINWLNERLNALNQSIEASVRAYSFAQYIPVDFTGHELCTADSWVQAIGDPAPLHPTASGQQAIADAVLSQAVL